jgi:hypothetical protein
MILIPKEMTDIPAFFHQSVAFYAIYLYSYKLNKYRENYVRKG